MNLENKNIKGRNQFDFLMKANFPGAVPGHVLSMLKDQVFDYSLPDQQIGFIYLDDKQTYSAEKLRKVLGMVQDATLKGWFVIIIQYSTLYNIMPIAQKIESKEFKQLCKTRAVMALKTLNLPEIKTQLPQHFKKQ